MQSTLPLSRGSAPPGFHVCVAKEISKQPWSCDHALLAQFSIPTMTSPPPAREDGKELAGCALHTLAAIRVVRATWISPQTELCAEHKIMKRLHLPHTQPGTPSMPESVVRQWWNWSVRTSTALARERTQRPPERTQRHNAAGADPKVQSRGSGPIMPPERTQRHKAAGADPKAQNRRSGPKGTMPPERAQRCKAAGADPKAQCCWSGTTFSWELGNPCRAPLEKMMKWQ